MSPWREMDRLRRDMNRLFTDWSTQARRTVAPGYPAMNVWAGQDSAIVTAELPGVNLEDIDISVEDDTLTLRGDRQRDELGEGVTYHRRERRFGSFLRTFQLPFRVDAAKVDATLKSGMLSISLPRAEEDKLRRIAIRAG
jgi:HSP20 family protein